MISLSLNREADEGCKKPLERLLNIWQERSVYGSEFIQQLKLSMEDSNSPQTKGKCILLVMCVLFLNWCMFPWKYCKELSSGLVYLGCCQSWLWRFFRTVLRSLIFVKPMVLVCRCAVLCLVAGSELNWAWCLVLLVQAECSRAAFWGDSKSVMRGTVVSISSRVPLCVSETGLLECLIQYC